MDKSFLLNIKQKQFVDATKQLNSSLSHKVMETLASRKMEIARGLGVPVAEAKVEDKDDAEQGDDGIGKDK